MVESLTSKSTNTNRMRSVLLLLILFSGQAIAQADYAITLKGDTLRGEVRILTYDLIDRVQIKTDEKKENFTAVQVRFVFHEGKKFMPVKLDNSIRLMELVTPGYLSLYAFRLPNQVTYDGRLLAKRGGTSMEVPNLSFRKAMGSFLEDCPEVSARIASSQWGKKQLDSIILSYNACIDAKSVRSPATASAPITGNETVQKIEQLKSKVSQSDLASKKDIIELLNSISQKVSSQESVPTYLTEGLKSYLANQTGFAEDLDAVLQVIKN